MLQTDPDELAPLNWHTVKKGETLLSIAKKLKVNRTDLAEANYLSSRSRLATGQRLIIPRAPALLLASLPDNPAPPSSSAGRRPTVAAISNTAPEGRRELAPTCGVSLIYRVKRGDTLFSIAKLFRTTVASLEELERSAHQFDQSGSAAHDLHRRAQRDELTA